MAIAAMWAGKYNFSQPHSSHPGFAAIFPKTLELTRFVKSSGNPQANMMFQGSRGEKRIEQGQITHVEMTEDSQKE